MSRPALALVVVALVPACRISLEGEYIAPLETDGGTVSIACMEAAAELHPTATFLYDNTFRRNCTGNSCHDASQPEAGLDLSSAAKARTNLVDVDATESEDADNDDDDIYTTDMKLVVPGQPAQSYLMLRVRQFAPEAMDPPQQAVREGDELDFYMPQDIRAGLCEGKRGALQRWIEDGAPL